MHDFAIEVSELNKSYRQQPALNNLDLRVPAGSIFGFLGRNGAGKTTTIKILMGMLRADSGTARVFGLNIGDPRQSIEARSRIGFVTEDKDLFPYMSVEQMLRFTRPFFPKWRDDLERRYLKMFDLPPKRKISDLSKGMRSKLMLLIAVCHSAELLILDEPTDGLDPAATEEVLRELVAIAASQQTTIFFSSHQLAEVEQIADSICIVDKGRAIVTGVLDDLKARYQRLRVVLENESAIPVRWVEGVDHVRREGRTLSILASGNLNAIIGQIESLPGATFECFPVGLKEIFLENVRSDANALV
jgi:ABC-2 type transport system ATP-binding protein